MKYKFFLKADCVGCMACLGFFDEFVKQIPGVSDAKLNSETGEVTVDYEGKLDQKGLMEIIKEKTGFDLTIK